MAHQFQGNGFLFVAVNRCIARNTVRSDRYISYSVVALASAV